MHLKIFPKVASTNARIGRDLPWPPLRDHLTCINNYSSVAYFQRLSDGMVRDEDADSALGQDTDLLLQLRNRDRVHACKSVSYTHLRAHET